MLLLFSEVVQKKIKQLHLNNLRLAFVHLSVSAQKLNQRELNLYLNTLPNWIVMKVTEQAIFLKELEGAQPWADSGSAHIDYTDHKHDMCMSVSRPRVVVLRGFQVGHASQWQKLA